MFVKPVVIANLVMRKMPIFLFNMKVTYEYTSGCFRRLKYYFRLWGLPASPIRPLEAG